MTEPRQPKRSPMATWHQALVSAFLVVHLLALGWWCFGVFRLPAVEPVIAGPLIEGLRGSVKAVERADPSGQLRRGLRAWIDLTGNWQNWEMFREVPRERGLVLLEGATISDAGELEWSPTPVASSDNADYGFFFLQNSTPPCGFRPRGSAVRDDQLLRSWIDHRLYRHEQETGERFAGARLVCHLLPLPTMDGSPPEGVPHTRVLWSSHR